jgi:peptidyl-prolyl cis-trans isomerase D
VSDPVQGQLSIVLLKVLTITPEKQLTLEEAKADLMKKLQLEKGVEALRTIYDQVEDARAEQKPFETIADTVKLPFILIKATDADGQDTDGKTLDIPGGKELLKRAFESDAGVENEAIPTDADGFLWYEVRGVVPAKPRPLETTKDKVRADLMATKLRELAFDRAKKLVERKNAGASFEDVAKEAGAEIKSISGLRRNETSAEFDAGAVSALFSVPEKGVAYAPTIDGKGAKVIEASKVLAPKFDPKEPGVATLRKSIADSATADIFDTYQSALQSNLGFTVNETLWRQITGTP